MKWAFCRVFVAVLVCVMLWHIAGCSSPDQTSAIMVALQKGHAEGHLAVATDGRLAAGVEQVFFLGAGKSTLTFDGKIDYSPGVGDALVWQDQAAKDKWQGGGTKIETAKGEEADAVP